MGSQFQLLCWKIFVFTDLNFVRLSNNDRLRMSSEKFCLRWNDFESNISVAFRELRDDKDFFDVTLACEDEQIQAHKVILSACSPFFRQILRRNSHQHPLLYLKGVKYTDIQSVLNFMYHGEVNVAQEDLNSFLAVAEELRVKGLTQGPNANSSNNKSDSRPAPSARSRSPPPVQRSVTPAHKRQIISQDDDIQEVVQVPVKSEPVDHVVAQPPPVQPKYYTPQPTKVSAPPQSSYSASTTNQQLDTFNPPNTELTSYSTEVYDDQQDESYDDYGQYVDDYTGQGMDQSGGTGHKGVEDDLEKFIADNCIKDQVTNRWSCGLCGQTGGKLDVSRHIEAKHVSLPNLKCDICHKESKTRDSLRRHMTKYHKEISM